MYILDIKVVIPEKFLTPVFMAKWQVERNEVIVEEWRELDEFPGYVVSSEGRVRGEVHGRIMTPTLNQQGMSSVGLTYYGEQYRRSVAILVAEAFIPEGQNDIFNSPVNIDGDRTNNSVDNLVWRPRWFAVKYYRQFREPDPYHMRVDIELIETGDIYPNTLEPAIDHCLLERHIIMDTMNHKGVFPYNFHFEVVN